MGAGPAPGAQPNKMNRTTLTMIGKQRQNKKATIQYEQWPPGDLAMFGGRLGLASLKTMLVMTNAMGMRRSQLPPNVQNRRRQKRKATTLGPPVRQIVLQNNVRSSANLFPQ